MLESLNSLFPRLPRWQLALLVYAFVVSAAECLIIVAGGGTFAGSLAPLLFLATVWLPIPERGFYKFVWWTYVVGLGYMITLTVYWWLCVHL